MRDKVYLKNGLIRFLCFALILISLSHTAFGVARVEAASNKKEFNAVWISYLEFFDRLKDPKTGKDGFTKKRFEAMIDDMYDQVVELKMNAVVVHVRPFGDAFYPSKYFPWSRYISGTQGKDPGFDPLAYMVKAAHKRGLEFHAWLNPYRITTNSTDVNKLAKKNIARKWRTDNNPENDRRVLTYSGSLYFNPSDLWVQFHIIDGIKEIVENYDVDGIHYDDYFYPTLGTNYKKNFDYKEYQEDLAWWKENGIKVKSIEEWRRGNVNRLVSKTYEAIKEIDESVVFGISPGGFLDYLTMNDRYYCDIKTWLSEPGYLDYIAPQIYWSFDHSRFPYDKTLDRWLALHKNKDVKVYVGIAAYKAGSNEETAWKKDKNILKKQIEYGRKTGKVDGFLYFRHDFLFKKVTQPAIKNLLKIL